MRILLVLLVWKQFVKVIHASGDKQYRDIFNGKPQFSVQHSPYTNFSPLKQALLAVSGFSAFIGFLQDSK